MKNRIGVMVDSFTLGVLDGLDAAKKIGAAAVQIYVGGRGAVTETWTPAFRKDVYKKMTDNGLCVSAMCGDMGGHGFAKREEHEWRIEETRRMFDLTRELGGTILTTHIGVIPEDDNHPRRASLMDAMGKLGEYAKETGCYVAIETGPEKPEVLCKFLNELGSERVGVNYDPANLKMVIGCDPVEGVRTLKGKIFHTHAKDGKMLKYIGPETIYGFFAEGGIEDMRMSDYFLETPLGEGDVDFKGWLNALEEIGYEGFFTIEREVGANAYADIETAVRFLKGLGL